MNELTQYILDSLEKDYRFEKNLSKSAVSTLDLYRSKATGDGVTLLKTLNINDDVFRTLNTLDSEGYLPRIFIVSCEEEEMYVLAEYVDGVSAAEIVNDSDQKQKMVSYFIDICSSLEILHANSIVHRDIKPSNIIIRPDGRAVLIDMSIAKSIKYEDSGDTRNLGTIGFAAPEQFGITQSRPETDIYALGITMNIMLTGEHPTISVAPGKIGHIIKKCTALNIKDRYKNVSEVKRSLKKIRNLHSE